MMDDGLTTPPDDDMSFGATLESKRIALSMAQKFGAQHLAASWAAVPHVTHHDVADVTDLVAKIADAKARGVSSSFLGSVSKCLADTLDEFPNFNALFEAETAELVLQRSVNLGYAIDTPRGLVVGVVAECELKGAAQIGEAVEALAAKARKRGLGLDEMRGGGFTVSSLGNLGGEYFTPIVNAPQVAILGLSAVRDQMRRGAGDVPEWRRVLPLSLSYDHRAINGADAGRFIASLKDRLARGLGSLASICAG